MSKGTTIISDLRSFFSENENNRAINAIMRVMECINIRPDRRVIKISNKDIKMNLKNCLNIGSEDSALDYAFNAFMFSAIESCYINRLSPEGYLRKLILGLHEKKVEKKQLLPCYIRL